MSSSRAMEPVDVGRLSNRVADAVEPHLGLLAQTALSHQLGSARRGFCKAR
jgi:hypothetical protein